jgi:NADPH-dependent 2,4-dienoyl-CoA reductase/sulfur reductase-like enzyme/rhodanese-related sulfurtransferase
MKVVIIGGVAGGASAAARLRRLDEEAEIVILERTGYVSYANCGLPYYVGDVIRDPHKLTLQTPGSFRERFNIDVRVGHEVTAIDRAAHTVHVQAADGGEYDEPYDKLILSPGAKAIIPDTPGIDSDRVFTVKTVEDAFALHDFVDRLPDHATDPDGSRMLVIGGGFIGLETAENLRERGLAVTVVQRGAHVMPQLDPDIAQIVENELVANGIDLRLKTEVTSLEERDEGLRAQLNDGRELDVAGVVCAIGVRPESDLAKRSGLAEGVRGSIKVDPQMRTSDPDIYAVGDAVEVTRFETGAPAVIALAGPANKQGRIAADAICGIDHAFHGSQGTSVMKAFSLTVSATGLSTALATSAGLDFDSVILMPPSHASYYPGSSSLVLKVLFERTTGRILGAQAAGKDGVEKRIDVLATAIRAHMTATDIAELDLAYAPPYSSAKDPVNMAGFMIQNIVEGRVAQVQWAQALDDVHARNAGDTSRPVLLDVRTDGEYARDHIEGALHIPVDDLRERIDELDPACRYNVHCQSGLRSYIACCILSAHGIACANVAGGIGFLRQTMPDNAGPCGQVMP